MTRTPRTLILLTTALLFGAAACGADGDKVAESKSRAVDATSTTAASTASSDGSSEEVPAGSTTSTTEASKSDGGTTDTPQEVDPACRPGAGRAVRDLPDMEIEAVQIPAFDSPDEKIGDTVIDGVHIPAVDLPAQRVEGGCVVRYDAPGGCLGAVEITGASLPGRSLPGATLPPVVVDGETLFEGERADGDAADGDDTEGDKAEQECRVESSEEYKSAVGRSAVSRPALSRAALSRAALSRPSICLDVDGEEECTDSVYVDSAYVDSEYVDSVYVDSAYLPSEVLDAAPDTSVLSGESEKAFVTPAEVLFDFDKFDLKPEASPTLQAIAAELQDLPEGATVSVDGHTDAEGTDAYNEDLSTKRAQAVATWLRTEGGVPADRITTKGYGESAPAAPNDTEADRALNRRVVVTLTEA